MEGKTLVSPLSAFTMLGSIGAHYFRGEAITQQQNPHSLLLRTPVPKNPMLRVNTTSHYKTEKQEGITWSLSPKVWGSKNQTVAKT